MEPIIRAEGLGKRYRLGARRAAYGTFRDLLADRMRHPFAKRREPREELWALADVTFDVEAGRVVGIIGRNGAGKSTLLGVLSRIIRPTTGRAVVGGRIASLLEIGTGFHPELTGRRNVFLSGAILGMTRREIERNFDAIVAFADLERFIDTPVKFYSTGMYLRLAFAVAAHLDAEILAIDEVLAVGDLLFQKKCLGKMTEVASDGRTVLLVSHSMAAIQALSDDVIVLEAGRILLRAPPQEAIAAYLDRLSGTDGSISTSDLRSIPRATAETPILVEGFLNGRPLVGRHAELAGTDLAFEVVLDLPEPARGCFVGINVDDEYGVRVWSLHSRFHLPRFDLPAGAHRVVCVARRPPLVPAHYSISVELLGEHERLDVLERITTVEIVEADLYARGDVPHREHGYVFSPADWSVTPLEPKRRVARS